MSPRKKPKKPSDAEFNCVAKKITHERKDLLRRLAGLPTAGAEDIRAGNDRLMFVHRKVLKKLAK